MREIPHTASSRSGLVNVPGDHRGLCGFCSRPRGSASRHPTFEVKRSAVLSMQSQVSPAICGPLVAYACTYASIVDVISQAEIPLSAPDAPSRQDSFAGIVTAAAVSIGRDEVPVLAC